MARIFEMMATEYSAQIENFVRMNEADLVGAAQKGDLDAFNQIVLLYQSKIYSLTYRILGERGSAEDITQETFLAAYLNLSRFRNGSFQGWLYRIATNACYDLLRWHKRRPTLSLDWEDNSDERPLPLQEYSDPNISLERVVERHELDKAIQQALNQLDQDQRIVVILVDLQGFNYQEAAETLKIPIGTVKSRLARARLRLQHLLSTSEVLDREN